MAPIQRSFVNVPPLDLEKVTAGCKTPTDWLNAIRNVPIEHRLAVIKAYQELRSGRFADSAKA